MDSNKINIIVVYNEKTPGKIAANQLKKLISVHKDEITDQYLTDEYIDVIAMEEKVYNDNSKMNLLNDKIIFIDGVKAISELKPIAEIKFRKHGVIYSVAGPQALLTVNTKKLNTEEAYKKFVEDLNDATYQGISSVPRGMNGFKNVLAHGLFGYLEMKDNIKKQQLIYGMTEFYNNHMKDFLDINW